MRKEKAQRRPMSLARILIFCISLTIFCYAGYQLFAYWRENQVSKQNTDQLAQQAVTVVKPEEKAPLFTLPEPAEPSEEPEETQSSLSHTIPLQVDFDVLQAENPDIIGWIYSEGTNISYPLLQGEDNQYYVKHLPNGNYNSSGAIFMDFRNDPELVDLNTIIYGHNMNNGTMFSTLKYYKEQAHYEEHPQMWILTRECAYRLDLIAGVVTASDSNTYTLFETKEELDAYVLECVENSTFDAGYDLSSVERIVTLSTCSYEFITARYVLIANPVPIPYG